MCDGIIIANTQKEKTRDNDEQAAAATAYEYVTILPGGSQQIFMFRQCDMMPGDIKHQTTTLSL